MPLMQEIPVCSPHTPRFGLASASAAVLSGRSVEEIVEKHGRPMLVPRPSAPPFEDSPRAANGLELEDQSSGDMALPPKTEAMCEGEQDYEVVFCDAFLGLELQPRNCQMGAIVADCLTEYTHNFVRRGSWVTSVNNTTVEGEPYEMIRRKLLLAQQNPPLTMTFRSPVMNTLEAKSAQFGAPTRGDLIFFVVVALNLKGDANLVEVNVGGTKVFTSTVKKANRNPEFKQRLTFRNFRPAPGRTATVTVRNKRSMRKNGKVGSCEVELPTSFSAMERHTLKIRNKKGNGNVTGLVVMNAILVVA